jgi:hypothetical protein
MGWTQAHRGLARGSSVAKRHKNSLRNFVGNWGAQKCFLRDNAAFLREFSALDELVQSTFFRELEWASKPDTRNLKADFVVFYLGRIAAEDFLEIFLLASNGLGVGALKSLRGMYERVVTAAFISKNPAEAHAFSEDDLVKRWKYFQHLFSAMPEIEARYDAEKLRVIRERCKAIQAERKSELCPRCKQPITQEAWTRVNLATMANHADEYLAKLYFACYLEPTAHSHATMFGVVDRLQRTETGFGDGVNAFRRGYEEEARRAVLLAHIVLLRLLWIEDRHFQLGLKDDIEARLDVFSRTWKIDDLVNSTTEL